MFEFTLEHYPELDSTNSLALDYARKGKPEGLVISADHQTAGRGKPGNDWLSPAGKNLLFSLLIRPPITAAQAPMITQLACRSVAKVLKDACGIDSEFKRPNDILVKGRKICGILTESMSQASGSLEAVVIGIGLNVNALTQELLATATSIVEETGKTQDLEALKIKILEQMKNDLQVLYAHSA
ncbi:MAG TPA: biotin--[acetyl-CoA-carboxylase] ligase [Verrucomicrobiae bacterium]|jgi:BirA family biotin operon repressor/biotin-[acetyl-CoA-carboxylase] ligase|nr:biotin--[acetyl-CoA-carboxylase] ligase [Verrucomicrobiae bacterium]